jgi:hypothetical protein
MIPVFCSVCNGWGLLDQPGRPTCAACGGSGFDPAPEPHTTLDEVAGRVNLLRGLVGQLVCRCGSNGALVRRVEELLEDVYRVVTQEVPQ